LQMSDLIAGGRAAMARLRDAERRHHVSPVRLSKCWRPYRVQRKTFFALARTIANTPGVSRQRIRCLRGRNGSAGRADRFQQGPYHGDRARSGDSGIPRPLLKR
jgi:hypothetical protein